MQLLKIEAVNPGFINIIVSGELLAANAEQMDKEERFGVEIPEKPKRLSLITADRMWQNRFM